MIVRESLVSIAGGVWLRRAKLRQCHVSENANSEWTETTGVRRDRNAKALIVIKLLASRTSPSRRHRGKGIGVHESDGAYMY